MREFFHGWRRKVGCVTLTLACAFAGMWVRSFNRIDCLEYLHPQHTLLGLESFEQKLVLSVSHYERSFARSLNAFSEGYADHDEAIAASILARCEAGADKGCFPLSDLSEVRSWGDFSSGTILKTGSYRSCFYVIPYWSLTAPLTLLATYLILWKPRKRNHPQILNDRAQNSLLTLFWTASQSIGD